MPRKNPKHPEGPAAPPVISRFQVGTHNLEVWKTEGRWAVRVDGTALSNWFMTQVDAWEAGVREADRVDKLRAAGAH